MKETTYRVGLDVGSTTAKMAVLDREDHLIYSRYERHNAKVNELVTAYLSELASKLGDADVRISVTGSVGMATAELLQSEFVQEVVAATVYARTRYPQAKALIDIGGEDAKVVFFNGRATELRMNGNCAGGTGAFIDQMAVLMGTDNSRLSELAMQSTHLYPMAARCGVFAKTDIQNLMARNLPESDIAASIFHSIAVQTVTTLSHGCDFSAPILLCGGPLTFLPALRKAFADYLKMQPADFIVTEESNLIPALGCAIRAAKAPALRISELSARLQRPATTPKASEYHIAEDRPQPLFKDEDEHQAWRKSKDKFATPVLPLHEGRTQIVIGIDSGSTTTKLVALEVTPGAHAPSAPRIVFTDYRMNLGNPINAVEQSLRALKDAADRAHCDLEILGSCSTGYGEELIKAAFSLDEGIIETMAHYHAAASLMPDVSFILDIGGQDMKAIFVDNGAVVRMELNEACSSGCGTFIQTFANNLGYEVEDFADIACTAGQPCDLGSRCTVFMNSKVKQVLREHATIADIAAGLSYSVVKNCLYKVLKLRGNDTLGDKVVVQGGTMRNDSVVRAFELLTHTEVARSNMPELMGALGCALQAERRVAESEKRVERQGEGEVANAARSIGDLLQMASYDTKMLHCNGCENHCFVTMYKFQSGRRFYSGNKCERVFNNKGKDTSHGENIYPYKYHLLFDRPLCKEGATRKIGVPRILNMYENYPFWNKLLTEAGFEVVLSPESNMNSYEDALNTVMSDNICFPAKLVHSHIKALDNMQPERILMPYVVYEHNEDKRTINSYNCPIVSAYSDVIRSAMSLSTPVDSPVINFADIKLLRKQIDTYLKGLGVSKATRRQAFEAAVQAQNEYVKTLHQKAVDILATSRKAGRLTILLAGRPYHTDPLIQHKLSEMIAALGADVISDDIVRGDERTNSGETYLVKQWAYMNRIVKSGQWAAEQGDDVHFVEMTSFGCGPDAFIQDEIRDILRRHNKPFTLLKIDDVSNTGSLKLRVRSLIESLNGKLEDNGREPVRPFVTTRVYHKADNHRIILAPYFTEYLTPLLHPIGKLIGYDIRVLPESDEESAQLGLEYANNEVCYPATLIVGDIVKALKSGKYNPDNIAFAMSQTGGQCRATNYAGLIKRAMVAAGFENVPLVTLGVAAYAEDENEQDGFEIPWVRYASIITTTLLYGDTISKMYHAAVVRGKDTVAGMRPDNASDGDWAEKSAAAMLRDKYMTLAADPIEHNDPKRLMELIGDAAREFDAITADKDVPVVGIVGEIFLKFNPFAHQYLAKRIVSRGIEVIPPLLTPFFLQEFVNVIVKKHMGLSCSNTPDFVVKSIYSLIERRIKKINKLAGRFRYFRPFTNIFEDAKDVNGVVSLAAQFGEGWLLPADIISLYKQGVTNVASLQPFGCIANHIVSKGIEKKLHQLYPDLNLVSLDFDSGVSAVNVTNRLLLFLDSIAV